MKIYLSKFFSRYRSITISRQLLSITAMLQAQPQPSELITLHPTPSFVVKTRLIGRSSGNDDGLTANAKLFINICTDDQVPLPKVPFSPEIVYPLIMSNQWEIPIATATLREATDKKGVLSYVTDCVVHSKAMRWAQQDKELRDILVEWCFESVELRMDVLLDRETVATPKMVSKGEVPEMAVLKSEMEEGRLNREVERLASDPLAIIEAQREDLEEEANVDIFNIGGGKDGSHGKPLIQEIADMSIIETTKAPPIQELGSKSASETQLTLNYTTTIQKTNINSYTLQIEIKSQNTTSLDYDLSIDRKTNTLILHNLNALYGAKDLEIPLPDNLVGEFKAFFVAKNQKLVIFVK